MLTDTKIRQNGGTRTGMGRVDKGVHRVENRTYLHVPTLSPLISFTTNIEQRKRLRSRDIYAKSIEKI